MNHLILILLTLLVTACTTQEKNSEVAPTTYSLQEQKTNADECIDKALTVKDQALQAVIAKEGDKPFEFLSAQHTDASALAIDGSIIKRTYGSSGFVQLVFNSGRRKCAVTVETRRQVRVLSDAVTCQ